jgi:ketosteroid isomerase-like protein
MQQHPNAALLETLYSNFAKGDLSAVLSVCGDQITFQVPGKSRLAGKYTKSNVEKGFFSKLKEFSANTFKMEVHDILASDRHATVLATQNLSRAGQKIELRTVHVWRFEHGKPVAWYEYPRDLYQFDATWA